MCSQRAIVDNLECCIDDLIDSFEDFIRKSLLIIFLGIGVVVGLLIYLLKMISERSPITNNTITENDNRILNKRSMMVEKIEREIGSNNLEEDRIVKTIGEMENKTKNNIMSPNKSATAIPSCNNMPREVGLSTCSKYGYSGAPTCIPSRVPIASSTITSKHSMIPCVRKRSLNKSNLPSLQICPKMTKPGSCCSMCCDDEDKPSESPDRPRIYRSRQ